MTEYTAGCFEIRLRKLFLGWPTFRNWALGCAISSSLGLAILQLGPDWLRIPGEFLFLDGIFAALLWAFISGLLGLRTLQYRFLKGFYEDGDP